MPRSQRTIPVTLVQAPLAQVVDDLEDLAARLHTANEDVVIRLRVAESIVATHRWATINPVLYRHAQETVEGLIGPVNRIEAARATVGAVLADLARLRRVVRAASDDDPPARPADDAAPRRA